ncbi:UNVERIFIED_CONTAM: hypothetical protein PYX00_006445 [Menopon gallinae]|uniref:Uncharacterized protein n=1 Tax=Menopon gallinae TaxID=328185 RepID=A0AAW2HVJ0_9NEOP
MANELKILGEELEREIATVQQALTLKTAQLEESRRKLRTEIVEHQMVKNCLDKNVKEMDGFKMELELTRKAVAKLEEENAKYRDSLAKLETQMDAYVAERAMLMDRCHNAEIENCKLRSQVSDLQDQLQEHLVHKERSEQYQANINSIISQVLSKQELLSKEQGRLEKAVKDGLSEANITRIRLEEETLQLLGALEEERREKRNLLESISKPPEETYLNDWRASQEHTNRRIRFLTEENARLLQENERLRTTE